MNEIDILKDLVSFNTIEDKENEKIINYIEKYLSAYGFETEKKSKFLIMQKGKNCKLGFVGHTDTVDYIDGWKNSPFELTKENNFLYGLGSSDMKGSIACFLQAIAETDFSKLKYGIRCYFTYDEERYFAGIKEIVAGKYELTPYILVGEPTDNVPMIGCKGLLALRIETKGVKVHSSNPTKGKSAISSMIKLLSELEDFYKNEIENEKNDVYEVPFTTMNIGRINGGSGRYVNSVVADCSASIDFRISKDEHINKIKEKLDELCKKYDGTYVIEMEIKTFYNQVDFLENTATAGFMTEASYLEGNRIILGPGPVTAHEVNEHVSIESLRKTVEQYKYIIEEICKE